MKKLFGIEITDEEFEQFFLEQSGGKELKVVDGKIVAVEHEPTEEEIKQNKIVQIQSRLNDLSQDLIQMSCGAVFDDKENRIKEFQDIHNELRVLLGKTPRDYEKNV